MFCPKCAAKNDDNAQFCRACGANISLVPQAVSGQLAERFEAADAGSRRDRRHQRRHGEPVTLERALRGLFMGAAFFFIAFAVRTWAPAGHIWWFWMFLPAAGLLADGVSTFIRLREKRAPDALTSDGYTPAAINPPPRAARLPERETGELAPPPSVTEGTTRHLSAEPRQRRGDV